MGSLDLDLRQVAERKLQAVRQVTLQLLLEQRREQPIGADVQNDLQTVRRIRGRIECGMRGNDGGQRCHQDDGKRSAARRSQTNASIHRSRSKSSKKRGYVLATQPGLSITM